MTWKMFVIIFTFALVMAYAAAELPSFMNVCARKDPDINKCIINSINNMRNEICEGVPDFDIPPLEPFIIDTVVISDTDNAKLYIRDLKVTRMCDFTITSFQTDIDKLHFNFTVLFKEVYVNGTCDFDIRMLVPIVQKGPVNAILNNAEAIVGVDMTLTKGDRTYVYVSKLNLKLNIKGLKIKFETSEGGSSRLNEILSTFVGSNQQELIAKLKPPVEREISKKFISIGNNIIKHFTFDELFPEGG